MILTDNEAQQLHTAIALLENPSLAARITSLVGSPIEKGFALLPEATEHMAQKGLSHELSPVLIRFISTIAERFGIQVSEKIAAQAVPIIGALGGAVINTVFIDHFQDMARGHFTVRKLERQYGKEVVALLYAEFNQQRLSRTSS